MTALWLRTTLRKQLLGHPRAMPGSGGGLRFIAYSHGKSSWGGLLRILKSPSLAFQACETHTLQSTVDKVLVFRQSSIDRFLKLEVLGIQEIPASAARQLKMDGTLVSRQPSI